MKQVATWEQMRTDRPVTACQLPANRALPNDVTQEMLEPGWTAQQPWAHASCAVALSCVWCAGMLDQRDWTRHPCSVRSILER